MKPERLRNMRIESGKTQQELATELKISLSALGNYERGDRTPDANLLISMAKLFGTTSDYILGISDSPKPEMPWPSAPPVGAVEAVEKIKQTVDTMLSSIPFSGYGLTVFNSYAEIFSLLLEIDVFAEAKLNELQQDYPNFRQFGTEMNMYFDDTPILLALASGYEEAVEFARQLTSTLREIEDKVVATSNQIESILLNDVLDAIKGTNRNIPPGNPIPTANEEQKAQFEQGRNDAKEGKLEN